MSGFRRTGWKSVFFILVGFIILATGKVAIAQSQGGWRGEYFNNMTLSGTPISSLVIVN